MNLERDKYLVRLRAGSRVSVSRQCGDAEGEVIEVLENGDFLVEYELSPNLHFSAIFNRHSGVSQDHSMRILTTLDFEAQKRAERVAFRLAEERMVDAARRGPRLQLRQAQQARKKP